MPRELDNQESKEHVLRSSYWMSVFHDGNGGIDYLNVSHQWDINNVSLTDCIGLYACSQMFLKALHDLK